MSREQLVDMAQRGLAHWRAGTVDLEPDLFRVPTTHYTDPGRWAVEMDRVFKRLPLMLGFSSELRAPHSYRAVEVAGVPVLMVRGDDEFGPYQSPMEDGMQQFHEWYHKAMGRTE